MRRFIGWACLLVVACGRAAPPPPAVSYCPECRTDELAWERITAEQGKPCAYDAVMRDRIRAELETLGPVPPLPSR